MHHNITADDNDFNGPIPTEIGKLTSLIGLNFETNNMNGPIPSEIEKLTALVLLNLGKCVCITVTQCFVAQP